MLKTADCVGGFCFIFDFPFFVNNILHLKVFAAIRAVIIQTPAAQIQRHMAVRATPYKMCGNVRRNINDYSRQNAYKERCF